MSRDRSRERDRDDRRERDRESNRRRVYIGRLDRRTRDRDVEDLFEKYGKILAVDMKNGYAFVEYDDERDAEDAIKALDGTELDGARIIVEQCHGGRKGRDNDNSNNECFNCGGRGHWARDCRSRPRRGGYRDRDYRDRRDDRDTRCYICDEYGHMARDCRKRRRSRSRSGSRSPRRSRDSRSRSRSPRRDSRRSPSPRKDSRDTKEDTGRSSPAPAADDSNGGKRASRSRSRSPANNE